MKEGISEYVVRKWVTPTLTQPTATVGMTDTDVDDDAAGGVGQQVKRVKRTGSENVEPENDDDDESPSPPPVACKSDQIPRIATLTNLRMAALFDAREDAPARYDSKAGPMWNAGVFKFVREAALLLHDARKADDVKTENALISSTKSLLDFAIQQPQTGRYMTILDAVFAPDDRCAIDDVMEALRKEEVAIREEKKIAPDQCVVPYTHFFETTDVTPFVAEPAPAVPAHYGPVVKRLFQTGRNDSAYARLRPSVILPEITAEMGMVILRGKHIDMLGQHAVDEYEDAAEVFRPAVKVMRELFEEDQRYLIAFSLFMSDEFYEAKAGWDPNGTSTPDGVFVYRVMEALLDAMPSLKSPIVVYRGVKTRYPDERNAYFISTTLSIDTANSFAGRKTVDEIFVPTGAKVLPSFVFTGRESEVTLHHSSWTIMPNPDERLEVPLMQGIVRRTIYVPLHWRKRKSDQLDESCQRVEAAVNEWMRCRDRTPVGWYLRTHPVPATDEEGKKKERNEMDRVFREARENDTFVAE